MQLTPRADKIIRILLRFSPDSPVTIGIISEELGVSDRSVHPMKMNTAPYVKPIQDKY